MRAQKIIVADPRTPDQLLGFQEWDAILLKKMFEEAKEVNASDIYITPLQNVETWDIELWIYFLVNEEKVLYKRIDNEVLAHNFTTKIKQIARADLSTVEKRQDLAFSIKEFKTRYRMNILPSEFGEGFVLRPAGATQKRISDLKLSEGLEKDLRWALQQKKGLVLFTGPTGSGKSTTIRAGIMELPLGKKEVLAIEDPVESIVPGVKHVPITRHLGWIDAIKGALRSKPHVLIVGEIRDQESAKLALEASSTGHLVLSTLHTNNVAGTVHRLLELGVDKHVLAENLIFVTSQELLEKLCPNCRIPDGRHFKRGGGCQECKVTPGVNGLVPLIEYSCRPQPSDIINFSTEAFEKNNLTTSFANETSKLVTSGLIDSKYLERF